jgi:DNA polymerase-3 subunit alpha
MIGQESLFGGATGAPALAEPRLAEVPQWTEREVLGHEKELLGFYVTGHPLGEVAQELARFTDVTAGTAEGREDREVRAGGLLVGLRETRTRRGQRMAFGTLEDLEGSFDLVIFAEPFEQHLSLLQRAKDGDGGSGPIPLLVTGKLEAGDPPKILVRDVMPLADAEQKLTTALRVRVKEDELSRDRLMAMRDVLQSHTGDCAVYLHITIPGETETVLAVGGQRGVDPSDDLRQKLDGLFGRCVSETGL